MKSLALIAASLLLLSPGAVEASQEDQNHASWIKQCQADRLYINGDKLEIREDGIFVRDENDVLYPLTNIFVDQVGIFTIINSLRASDLATVWNIAWCRTCRNYRSIDINGRCVRCGNPP